MLLLQLPFTTTTTWLLLLIINPLHPSFKISAGWLEALPQTNQYKTNSGSMIQ